MDWAEGGGGAKARSRCKLQKLSQTDSKIVERNKMLGIFCIVSDIKSHNTHTHNALADTHPHTHTHLYSGANAVKGFAWVLCLFGVCLLFQLFVVLV